MSLRLNCNAAPFSPIDRAPGSSRPVSSRRSRPVSLSRPGSLELGPFSFGSNFESSCANSSVYESACESNYESAYETPVIRTEFEYPELAKVIFDRESETICNINDWWYNNKSLFDESYEDLDKIFQCSKIPIQKDIQEGELKRLNVEKIKPSKCVKNSLTPIDEKKRTYVSFALKDYLRS